MSMSPTPEMIEAACRAYANGDVHSLPYKSGMEAALTAALALLPGEPVGYMRPKDNDGNSFWCAKSPGAYYSQPLYASPAPLPVAVKIKPLEWREESIPPAGEILAPSPIGLYCVKLGAQNFYPLWLMDKVQLGYFTTIEEAKAAAQADYESRIRSALSSPVGGTEEQTPSSNVAAYIGRAAELIKRAPPDFADKDQHIEWGGEAFVLLEEMAATRLNELPPISDVLERIAADISALTLHPTTNVEYDAGYIGGRGDAFAIVQEAIDNLPASPTPDSDIAALREELSAAASLLETLSEELPDDDVSGIMMKVMAERNRSALQHIAKGERG